MQKLILLTILFFCAKVSMAQSIQWASKILDFSSELFSIEFSAEQSLGIPSVLPIIGENPGAWAPNNIGKKEFLKVGFDKPMKIKQVAIAETYNSGALSKVFAYTDSFDEYLLFEFHGELRFTKGGLFNIYFDETTYLVSALKLVYDGSKVKGRINIDAIAISNSIIPISFGVSVKSDIRSDITVEKLGANINSEANEIKPILSPDGKFLFFSRQYHPGNVGGEEDPGDIWVSEYNEQRQDWSIARNLGTSLNNRGQNFINSFSPNGNGMIAVLGGKYGKSSKLQPGVSLSNNFDGNWSKPATLDFVTQSDLKGNFDLNLSADRKMLLIANHGEVTYGDKDLYVSFLQKNGTWSEPINLGPNVNTINEESSPFLAPDGETLFFSSRGFAGYGGSDIYVTHRLDNTWTNWSEPENIGPVINSDMDETSFNIPSKGGYAYFSRYDSKGNADIFLVKQPLFETPVQLTTFKGSFFDQETQKAIVAKITSENQTYFAEGKEFLINLPSGNEYQFTIEAKGYRSQTETLNLATVKTAGRIVREIFLEKIKEEILTFENITFISNDTILHDESFEDLNKIVALIESQPEISMEISSHTDNIGSEENNKKLSKARAEVIFRYFVNHGISPDRLVIQWFGESRPIASNDTEDGRKKNRRVEFKIIRE